MTIEIRELDPHEPGTDAVLLPVLRAASAVDSPRHPEANEAWVHYINGPRIARHRTALVAFDGAEAVGYGLLNQDLESNQDMVYGDIWIRPEHRADTTVPLVDAFKAYTRSRGGKRLVSVFSELAVSDYEQVFAAEGGRLVSREWRSQLDLRAIDRERYAAWAAPSEKNAHYRIEYWVTPTPEHLLEAMVRANEAMRDAPTGDLAFEYPPPSVDRRRRAEALSVASGERKHVVAALTDDGVVAGFHELYAAPGFGMADVGNTGVPAGFRGHGLGLRLKADLALRLAAAEPEIETVSTWNGADNEPMLRVNEALGYERAEAWSNWQFDL
ncbi:GNAT family N-acetyltransferase [Catenulispora yoronensis]|uniref:GNAT family N-acetyltransferase n=1 Tax=Catenulispora yoronensis TaxID=450799 RepID=A0ABP5FTN1_9ACTN